jgi:hypothetical protein
MRLLPKLSLALTSLPLISVFFATTAIAQNWVGVNQIADSSKTKDKYVPVNRVSDLKDVTPDDWAFSQLRHLIEQYQCVETYPDMTYQGQNTVSRYEFASMLNTCLNKIEEKISSGDAPAPGTGNTDQYNRLIREFEDELASLGNTVDELELRLNSAEENQFSTTTKLQGEVAFTLADTFGTGDNTNTVFTDKVRLQLVSSFTGKDKLITRLTAGNLGNSFGTQIGTNEGRYAYDGPGDNNITIDRLHYYFPIGEKLTMYTMAKLAGHHFYADTFNSGLDVGGGSNGALSRFAERNPLYRFGLSGNSAGVGLKYDLGNFGEASIGYIASTASNPTTDNGLFDGSYSAMAQLVITPSDDFKLGVSYFNNYSDVTASVGLGGTGTPLANTAISSALGSAPVKSNAFGLQALYDIDENVSLRGWVGYIDADSTSSVNSAEIWTYAGVVALNNLGKDNKDMAYFLVGVEPYLAKANNNLGTIPLPNDGDPVHIELAYKKSVANGITVTPGLIWLAGTQQNQNNKDVFIGTLRTTFSF